MDNHFINSINLLILKEILESVQAASVTMVTASLEVLCCPWPSSVDLQMPRDPAPSPESTCQGRWNILT